MTTADAPGRQAPREDRQKALVRTDYNAKVALWRGIYDGASFHDHTIQRRLARTLDLLDRLGPPAGRAALDVGCGAGQLVAELARRGWDTAGVDIAERMVAATADLVRAEGLRADVRVADVTALPFPDGRFAVVTALGVIEYLRDPAPALAEFARVLAPGGHLVVTAPNPLRLAFLADPVRVVATRLRPPRGGYPRRYSTAAGLRRAVAAAGLRPVEVRGHGVGEWTVAGQPVLAAATSIRVGLALERALPEAVLRVLGANLVAVARKG